MQDEFKILNKFDQARFLTRWLFNDFMESDTSRFDLKRYPFLMETDSVITREDAYDFSKFAVMMFGRITNIASYCLRVPSRFSYIHFSLEELYHDRKIYVWFCDCVDGSHFDKHFSIPAEILLDDDWEDKLKTYLADVLIDWCNEDKQKNADKKHLDVLFRKTKLKKMLEEMKTEIGEIETNKVLDELRRAQ